jgi:transposase, IS5 family
MTVARLGRVWEEPQIGLELRGVRSRMRQVIPSQLSLDEADIAAIYLDPKSRDDILQLLRGLQHIYTEPSLRERVFAILREVLPQRVKGQGQADANTGRPGMQQ